jgi:hypothetical protein
MLFNVIFAVGLFIIFYRGNNMNKTLTRISPILFVLILGCCSFFPKPYSETIYNQMVDCKQDALSLMDKGSTSYSQNKTDIDSINTKMSKLKSLLDERCSEDVSCQQYEIMMASDKGLLGEFLVKWEENDTFSNVFIAQWKINVSTSFDKMIETENSRKK